MSTITRPTPGPVEERTALDVPAPTIDGRRLHGVIPYGVESRDLGGFREIIEPGALADADLSDLIATREHDRAKLLGRHPTTLTTEDRSDGFAWSVELPQSPVGEDVRVAIERGDLRSTSWRMVVAPGGDEWRGDVRHVKRIAELRGAVRPVPNTGTDATYEAVDRAMYLTAAMTGLHIGELQALDWRSVDFTHARIRVRRTWDRKTKTYTKPKSRRSERAVPMPDAVATQLERLLRTYHPEAVEPNPDSLVFGHPITGDPLGHRLMYERLRATLKRAGLDELFAWHTLRHSYGTALAAQGVPMRSIQEWMGHKDIQTTQRYADYCPNPGERDVVEAAFARGTNAGTNLPTPAQN